MDPSILLYQLPWVFFFFFFSFLNLKDPYHFIFHNHRISCQFSSHTKCTMQSLLKHTIYLKPIYRILQNIHSLQFTFTVFMICFYEHIYPPIQSRAVWPRLLTLKFQPCLFLNEVQYQVANQN